MPAQHRWAGPKISATIQQTVPHAKKSAPSHSAFQVRLLSHCCTWHTRGGGLLSTESILNLLRYFCATFEPVPAEAQPRSSRWSRRAPAGCGLSGRLVPVPMFPAGGPLHGELVDVSTVRPEKHLWVSAWACVCLAVWEVRPGSSYTAWSSKEATEWNCYILRHFAALQLNKTKKGRWIMLC